MDEFNEQLIRRVMDSYDSVSEIMDAAGFDLWELIDLLIEEGYINDETMPHIFNTEYEDNDTYYDK